MAFFSARSEAGTPDECVRGYMRNFLIDPGFNL